VKDTNIMRVLLVVDGMHPRYGGPPAVVAGSAIALRKLGAEVMILTTDVEADRSEVRQAWSQLEQAGVITQFCSPVRWKELLPFSAIEPCLCEALAWSSVVHLHGIWNPILTLTARVARKKSQPYFYSTHGVLDHRAMKITQLKYVKKRMATLLLGLPSLINNSSGLIFGSHAEADKSWILAPEAKQFFIPNGVMPPLDQAQPSLEQSAKLKAIVPHFEEWERVLLYFARIHPSKGTDLLVQAFNAVAPDFPGVGLLIAGLKEDVVFQAQVEEFVARTPVPSRIVLTTALTGQKSHFLYRISDAYVLPSHAEGFSVSLIEALAHGMPVLITDQCHMPEIQAHRAGIIVETTVDGLAEGLRTLLSHTPEALYEMGQNAAALHRSQYTWSKVALLLLETYQKAINEKVDLQA
jgi:glycosyltransferase involved in cell wall biosynthesis